jgi:hypothetical protein
MFMVVDMVKNEGYCMEKAGEFKGDGKEPD